MLRKNVSIGFSNCLSVGFLANLYKKCKKKIKMQLKKKKKMSQVFVLQNCVCFQDKQVSA